MPAQNRRKAPTEVNVRKPTGHSGH
jgi:hypothetical protein